MTDMTWYKALLASWQPKLCGPKPTAANFTTVHGWGFRPGVEALHLAMCLRPTGCTVRQFCIAGSCGPANNKRRLVVQRGWAKVSTEGKPYAFTLTVTPKGDAVIKANTAKAAAGEGVTATVARGAAAGAKAKAKGAKAEAKANGKPRRAPRKPADAPQPSPAGDAAPQGETAPAATGEAPEGNSPQA